MHAEGQLQVTISKKSSRTFDTTMEHLAGDSNQDLPAASYTLFLYTCRSILWYKRMAVSGIATGCVVHFGTQMN
jgi:hypothetical protein